MRPTVADLDELLKDQPIAAPTLAGAPTERKCRRHVWGWIEVHHELSGNVSPVPDLDGWRCARCGKPKNEIRSRRGKSSRRLGNDGERRSEKRYGWRKTGEFGGIDDLVGTLHVVQQKTTRSAPPLRWKGIFARLDERAAGRIPLILLSFVRAGVDTEDFVIVRGKDWLALHGKDGEG
jgi:hypothetical protein